MAESINFTSLKILIMKKSLLISILFLSVFFLSLNASNFTGDVKSWTKNDFLGFDKVGDCSGLTGDITSVYARIENNQLSIEGDFR